MVMFVAIAKMVGMQGQCDNRLGLSPGMLELVVARWAAHLAQLSYLHFVVAYAVFHLANKKVEVVVSCDAHAYVKQQTN